MTWQRRAEHGIAIGKVGTIIELDLEVIVAHPFKLCAITFCDEVGSIVIWKPSTGVIFRVGQVVRLRGKIIHVIHTRLWGSITHLKYCRVISK